ncbi:MAG: Rpn family recombination-promoting nuclease/putative transposase [Cytophagales bacterium]|nr:Rpn family recombination-promoting nuclease/putative transposase [Cytophagales bacterium]
MSRYLDPTNDLAFKRIFTDKKRLISLLNAIMQLPEEQPIVELTYISQEQIPGLEHRKSGLVDIKCTDKAGNIFIVEMQNGYSKYLLKRLQFYSSSAYVAQLKQGMGYGELAPVFVIVLLGNQVLSPNLPLISYHKMIETDSGEQLFEDISYIVVELKKFIKREDELASYLDYWLYFLSRWDIVKNPPKTLKEATILEAYEQLERYQWSEEEYQLYLNAKALAEQEAENLEMKYTKGFEKGEEKGREEGIEIGKEKGREEGRAEGIEVGKEKGRREGVLETAKNLIKQGVSLDVIAQATGLSPEELAQLS